MNSPEKQNKAEVLKQPEHVVAAVPKEAFKAMFYLFAGRPDSKTKLFRRKILITPDEIYRLSEQVTDKLKLHNIDQVVATATIKFKKQEIIQFGTWAEFKAFDWMTSESTQEVSVKWDFMIKLDEYGASQRHTLTVKITGSPNPRDVFQMLMSRDDDDDELEGRLGVCIARVDFISHRLADELIDIVEKWNRSLKKPHVDGSWFSCLEKYDSWIARCIHFSIPIFSGLIAFLSLDRLFPNPEGSLTQLELVYGLRWLLASGVTIFFTYRLGQFLARRAYSAVNEYGSFTPFRMTRGDENAAEENKQNNGSKIRSFILNAGFALLLNIIAGIIVWKISQ